jgi:hypothetical protein
MGELLGTCGRDVGRGARWQTRPAYPHAELAVLGPPYPSCAFWLLQLVAAATET